MSEKTALFIYEHADDQHNMNRVGILRDILVVLTPWLILGVIAEWLGDDTTLGGVMITLAYVLGVVLATVVLKRRGSGWREVGLARPDSWRKTILLGLGAFVVTTLAYLAIQIIMQNLPGLEIAPADKSNYNPIYGNLPLLIVYLAATWTTIGFGEEMLFRGFLLNSLAGFFRHTTARWALAVIGSSLIFGLIHFSWGFAGVVETTIMGLVLGFIYLRIGHNLWVTIIAHGLMNTIAFVLMFSEVS
ncbi:MAG: CPBP family intramembrane metalloprotease [Chloroflexi bacterium]|nr:CPBP family intramembrane metalloprotease [Chloroflexota bacterium]